MIKEYKWNAAGKAMTIRPMKKEDVPAISKLAKASFSMPWSENAFLEVLNRTDSLYVTALAGDMPIGCCGVTNACGDGDINNVMVDEKYRCMGIGRLLLNSLMEWGKALGISNYTLEVRVSNAPAIHLYESLGFTSAGIRPGFYELPREDAVIMWKRQEADGQITMPE